MLCLELLSVEHHKTKTRLVALVSHYGPRQPSGTNQNSKKMYVTKTKHECVMIAKHNKIKSIKANTCNFHYST